MVSALIFVGLAFAQDKAQKPAGPPPDRSGEPVLRQLLDHAGKLRHCTIVINKSNKSRDEDPAYPGQTVTLWYDSPTRFRSIAAGTWGDQVLTVRNDNILLADYLDDSQPASRRNVGGNSIYDTSADLAFEGQSSAAIFYFLNGLAAFDSLVAADGSITISKDKASETVRFKTKGHGTMYVTFDPADKNMAISRIAYDDLEVAMKFYEQNKEFVDKPDQPMNIEEMSYTFNAHFPKWAFDTTPAKGHMVDDKTKKG